MSARVLAPEPPVAKPLAVPGFGVLQRRLAVGETDDPLEREAERIAGEVVAAPAPVRPGVMADAHGTTLRRACARCEEEEGKTLQRAAIGAAPAAAPPAVANALAQSGAPLPQGVRAFMEPRFGADFSRVRIHTGRAAAQSAEAVNARAYTVGEDIAFAHGAYVPESVSGRRLIAHELTHVLQQSNAGVFLQRQARPRVGTRFQHPPGVRSPHRAISATFDGAEFEVFGGTTSLMRTPAQSGRPVAVRSVDARACSGSTSDSYLNNRRYVGIADYGPIPEGQYNFRATSIATFSATEQASMIAGGHFTDPFGATMHGGDWGAGRVALNPVRVLPGPCGNTRRRSGFYLHGGNLTGSSGCIDVANSGVAALLPLLHGYTNNVNLRVRYTAPVPSVGTASRALGGFVYPGQSDPTLRDRMRGFWNQLTETEEGAE